MPFSVNDPGHVTEHNRLHANQRVDNYLLVRSAADLPAASAGEHLLPSGGVVEFAGTVDLGANAIRIPASNPPVVRGQGGDRIVSSATGGVVRCTNPDAALVLREFSIVASAGPCLNLSSNSTSHQLNLFFVGLFGAEAGTISGFDVQAVKQCLISAAHGLTFAGTTNKVFVSETPFYGITSGSAITFAANLNATVADIVTSFFKFDSPGTCITAETGYTVGDGLLRGSLVDGTAIRLDVLSPSDVNWQMDQNLGIRDSRIAAQAYLTTPATMVIATQGTYVPVAGAFTVSNVAERFTLNGDNELVYTGRYPALLDFDASFTIDTANNQRLGFRASKNGVALVQSTTIVEQGAGPGSSPRPGNVAALVDVETGDRIGLQAANLEGTSDIDWLSATYVARG